MLEPTITDYGLEFGYLEPRDVTDQIVIHHTGNPTDDDLSAEEIHESHKAQGWSGIGYHFVIRKDGTIERGRPMDTIGIHVCGNFDIAEPTDAQIESCSVLVQWLALIYGLEINDATVVGHCDLMATACPGENLYRQLGKIRGKANWYEQNYNEDGEYIG